MMPLLTVGLQKEYILTMFGDLVMVENHGRISQKIKILIPDGLQELEESQWWPQERIEQLQAKRLQHLARYDYERDPYYRRLKDAGSVSPDSIRTPADLP